MGKYKLRGKDLRALGYPDGPVIGLALGVITKHYKKSNRSTWVNVLSEVLEKPEEYRKDVAWGKVATALLPPPPAPEFQQLTAPKPFAIYGDEGIEQGAKEQMSIAVKLPVAIEGALMPDAHQGYGLPIGGVLAVDNAVIPYGVGVDIGCRMCLSIFELPASMAQHRSHELTDLLKRHSKFGKQVFDRPARHEVLDRDLFKEIPLLKHLQGKAQMQIGSSGGGNHFVEFGAAHIQEDSGLEIAGGQYLALLSHSGSRGLGAAIAQHYTRIAMEKCPLPKFAKSLAWLDLDSEEGQEYWLAMNLAGDYASACHHDIHRRISKALGERAKVVVENHHNFAWKEKLSDGREAIVHRKGATPAGEGVLGVIPGTMTDPGFIVRGRGELKSINSASHGAGRTMSRSQAKASLNKRYVSDYLEDRGITLLGGGLDEAPMAYKNIQEVMGHQQELVDIVGTFHPKIVRMAGDKG